MLAADAPASAVASASFALVHRAHIDGGSNGGDDGHDPQRKIDRKGPYYISNIGTKYCHVSLSCLCNLAIQPLGIDEKGQYLLNLYG